MSFETITFPIPPITFNISESYYVPPIYTIKTKAQIERAKRKKNKYKLKKKNLK